MHSAFNVCVGQRARDRIINIASGLICVCRVEKANALAAMLEARQTDQDMVKMVPRLPEVDDTHFPLKISYVSIQILSAL